MKRKAPAPTKTQGAGGEQLSFLPPRPFPPIWPSHTTIAGRVLAELLRGEWLDHKDVIEGCSSWRSAAYVKDLKNKGWPIKSIDKPAPFDNCPSRSIAIYALPPAIIEQVQSVRGAT